MGSYYQIGHGEAGDLQITLYELAESQPQVLPDFSILDEVTPNGDNGSFWPLHMPYEYQLKIEDRGNLYYQRMRNRPKTDFIIEATEGSALIFKGLAINNVGNHTFWKQNNVYSIVASDGVTSLKAYASDYTSDTGLGDLLYSLINDIGLDLPVNLVFDLHQRNGSMIGLILPNQTIVNPRQYVHDLADANKYQLLMRVLGTYRFQLFQQDGEFWVMQRDVRSQSSLNRYRNEGSGWDTLSLSPSKTIETDDLRTKTTNAYSFERIYKVTRTMHIEEIDLRVRNGNFDNFTNGEADYWTGSAGTVTQRTGPTGIEFDNKITVRTQITDRVLKYGDRVNFRISLEYYRAPGLSGSYEVGLAQIKYFTLDGTTFYLRNDGTWDGTPGFITDTFTTDPNTGYPNSASKTFNIDSGIVAFNGARLQIRLALSGDTDAFTSSAPVEYNEVSVTPIGDLADQITDRIFTVKNTLRRDGAELTEDVYIGDVSEYNNNSVHRSPQGNLSRDWSDAPGDQPLHKLITESYLGAAIDPPEAYLLRLPIGFDVSLYNSVVLPFIDENKTYLPLKITKSRKAKKLQVYLVELKESSNLSTDITFDTT